MHSYFPYPNDRVIILHVHNEPDSTDSETVRSLIESKIRQYSKILILLDADCSEKAFANWISTLFDEIGIEGIERLALISEAINLPPEGREMLAFSEVVRQFTPAQREQALFWIQTGGNA